MCFDTTASNTGNVKGACLFLEELLDRELAYFACRHHIFEVVLRHAFEPKLGKNKGPDVPVFERMKKDWNKLNRSKFKCGLKDKFVRKKITDDVANKTKQFCLQQLTKSQSRADYKEFLELEMLFLGETTPNFRGIRRPGPTCHARWMAKAINALKMFLLRNEISLQPGEFDGMRDVCIFVCRGMERCAGCQSRFYFYQKRDFIFKSRPSNITSHTGKDDKSLMVLIGRVNWHGFFRSQSFERREEENGWKTF